MDNENSTISVACPACKKQMRMRNPQTPGMYKITCPFCGKPFPVKIVDNQNPAPEPQPVAVAPATGEPVVEQFCSNCGMKLRIRNPQPGQHNVRCPKCQSVQTYTYADKGVAADSGETKPVDQANKTKPTPKNFNISRGCLVPSRGRFRSDRTFELAGKETIIGRHDPDAPCDVMIDDATMSRRSVSITAETKSTGLIYKLTVLNATNKVTHNGKALSVGSGVYLEFGDTIVLGRTTFKFEKSQNQ